MTLDSLTFIIPLVVGLVIGGAAGFIFGHIRNGDEEAKAKYEKLQNEFNEYRSNVRQHFVDTVSLLSQIDERQKQLYQNISTGVNNLCSSKSDENNVFLEQSVQALTQLDDVKRKKLKKSESS